MKNFSNSRIFVKNYRKLIILIKFFILIVTFILQARALADVSQIDTE